MTENESIAEIVICMGSSCFSRGNSANLAAIQEFLKAHALEANVKLVGSRCEEECMHGPVVKIDGQSISGVTPDSIQVILSERLISHDKE